MADRFVTAVKSQTAAINSLADRSTANVAAVTTNTTVTARTMTAAEFMSGVFVTTAAGALALTFPTAADIIAAIPNAQVGSKAMCWLVNASNNTVTITTNTGLTITGGHGTATAATNTSQLIIAVVTAATTVTLIPVLKTAS